MKLKHKNWSPEDTIIPLVYTKYDSNYGYFVISHDNRILFFYTVEVEDRILVTYDDVTDEFEIIDKEFDDIDGPDWKN
jgi:hypothetical protein